MRKQSGITMGEVLFVAGLAVLACAILMYVWLHTGTTSRHRVCASNVRQLGTAMVMYAMDHDDAFPPYGNIAKLPTTGAAPKLAPQPALLRACLRLYTDDANWFCPADPVQGRNVVYLGIDHQATSYAIPAMQDGHEKPARVSHVPASTILVSDAAGDRNSCESGVWFGGSGEWASNHPDGEVNYVEADLSLHRGDVSMFVRGK